MKVVKPETLAILTSTAPENEAPLWSAATTYSRGDRVIRRHYVYQYVADDPASGIPPETAADIDGAPWRTLSVTNQWACIDYKNHTQTIAPEGQTELVIEVPYSNQSMVVGLLNMSANSVAVGVKDKAGPDGVFLWGGETQSVLRPAADWWDYWFAEFIYDEQSLRIPLLNPAADWWDYWFGEFTYRNDLVLETPPLSGVLWISLRGERPAIGNIVVGRSYPLGGTQYGARMGYIDYSMVTTDGFGNDVWIKRHNAKRGVFPVLLKPSEIDYAHKLLTELAGTPALWIGDDGTGYESMTIFGFAKEVEEGLDAVSKGTLNLEIRGMI